MFGAWAAAWPLIRDDLSLSYVQVGILLSLPHLLGSVVELPLFLLADGPARRTIVRSGAVAFVLALLLVAASGGFGALLLALVLANPASGAFVGLSQAVLMDLQPGRHEQNMVRWSLAGAVGALAAPLALHAAASMGLGWRGTFGVFAFLAAALAALAWRVPMRGRRARGGAPGVGAELVGSAREALGSLREREVLRWLGLLQLSDLMLDVFHGYLALYFVDVAGAGGSGAAAAILVWTGFGLVGEALLIPLLERVRGTTHVRVSAAAALVVFPCLLLVDGTVAKLALVALLALCGSGWYAVLKGRLYAELPGRSATALALGNVAGIVGAALPLLVGLVAQRLGLGAAMWLLLAAPIGLLLGVRRER